MQQGNFAQKDEWASWFGTEVLRSHLIETTNSWFLRRLFGVVPAAQFSDVAETILAQLEEWDVSVWHKAIPILAQVAPEKATSHLQEGTFENLYEMLGYANAVPHLPTEQAHVLLPLLLEKALGEGSDWSNPTIVSKAIHTAYVKKFPDLSQRLQRWFSTIHQEKKRELEYLCKEFYPGHNFFTHFHELLEYDGLDDLSELDWMFSRDALLDELEHLLFLFEEEFSWDKSISFLHSNLKRWPDPIQAFFLNVVGDLEQPLSSTTQRLLVEFLFALQLSRWCVEDLNLEALTLQETISRLSAGIGTLPQREALIQNLNHFPRNKVEEQLLEALRMKWDDVGAIHLTAALGDFPSDDTVDVLLTCITEEAGDYLCEEGAKALARIGEKASRAIIHRWDTLDITQKIYGIDVLKCGKSSSVVAFLQENFDEFSDDIHTLEAWCGVTKSHPDLKLLPLIESELSVSLLSLSEKFCTLCLLHEQDHPKLNDVRTQIHEQEAENQSKTLQMMGDNEFWLNNESLRLELRCTSCGKARCYDISQVFVSHEDPTPFFGGETACLHCGHENEFELTPQSQLTLMGEMAKMTMFGNVEEYEGPLSLASMQIEGSRVVSIREGVEYYEDAMRRRPKDVAVWLGAGNLFSNVGREKKAQECYKTAIKLDPSAPEPNYQRALHLYENEKEKQAFQLLHSCLLRHDEWKFYKLIKTTEREFVEAVVSFHNDLCYELSCEEYRMDIPLERFSQTLPYSLQQYSSGPKTVVNEAKVGRNEPCPCGSGKKYKKCCLRK